MSVATVESGKSVKLSDEKTPKSVIFILINVFCERLSSGGILSVLAIFLYQKLDFNSNQSTALFHVNEFILYFSSIVGAIIADSWLGLYKTLSYMGIIYVIGASTTAVASIDALQLPIKVLSIFGLLAVFAASGGIKSNQNAFGGNQFKLPEQEKQLSSYFSIQYFIIKCGLLLAQISFPMLRSDVQCFGMNDCYPLAFGASAFLMFFALIVLLSGNSSYIHVTPKENMFLKICKCSLHAATQKFIKKKVLPKAHWLDYAEEKFGPKLVTESKMVLNVLKIFLTLPIFWALYAQLNSRWVFQASKMDGDIGFYVIKPDQMMMSTTIFILFIIPIFDYVLYPFLARFGLKTPLQKMSIGYIFSAAAFIVAAFIEWKIQDDSKIPMLWLLPQYFMLAVAEVFVWVSNITFSYTQAPNSMKSVMSSFSYMVIAGGSFIIIVVSGSNFFKSQIVEFLFYSGLMILNTICFIFMAKGYKYVEIE